MPPESARALIATVGVLLQLAGSVLLVVLFALLRRYAERRVYFDYWYAAWVALTVAIAAVIVRYILYSDAEAGVALAGLHGLYIIGKLATVALLLIGTVAYTAGLPSRRSAAVIGGVALVYAVVAAALNPNLSRLVFWQAPVAVPVFAYCAWRLLSLPIASRSLGSQVAGLCFAMLSVLWVIYAGVFGPAYARTDGAVRYVFELFTIYNSYIDGLLQMLLGFGMVVLLMEDAKRRVDDAHAELAVAHDYLQRASFYDVLTGCLNRRAFAEGVGLDEAKATFGTIVVLDMDLLKDVNDRHGHAAGDALLRHLARVLHSRLRPSDKVYRWGGDEFLLLLPGARTAKVQKRMEALMDGAPPLVLEDSGVKVPLRASIGCATYANADTIEAAIHAADQAMYERKLERHAVRRSEASGGDD